MAGIGGASGFTLLVWIDSDSWRLEGLEEEQRLARKTELLGDVVTLLCGRWGMEASTLEDSGEPYAFFVCPRFVVSTATISRALGDLAPHVKFHRGAATDKAQLLIEYKKCLAKWNVPDRVSEGSFGEESGASQYTSTWGPAGKRSRKS